MTSPMFSYFARNIAIIALAFASTSSYAARGLLRADGVVRVKGGDPSTTLITVVPFGAPSYSLPMGTLRFLLLLPLDDLYLVSVSGTGCPTKEVYFDTRVPVDMHAMDFEFPFMVTLEHMAPERMFVYAGPVGFVRYMDPLNDFGYETQYTVRVNESLLLRMAAMRATGVETKTFLPITAARVVDRPRGQYSASSETMALEGTGTLAPLVSEVAPMVHVVNAVGPTRHADPPKATTITGGGNRVQADSYRAATVHSELETRGARVPDAVPPPFSTHARDLDSAAEEVGITPPVHSKELTVWLPSRTEELITGARTMTRIVRFSTPLNGTIEFRKVTHVFGAVYFFQGNRSITQRDFEEATAPEAFDAH